MNTRASESPYPGPRAFTSEEQRFFFGRDRETSDLSALISAHREVVVYAQSGTGKSSLLNAALIPRLSQEDLDVLPTARVGGTIPEQVAPSSIDNVYAFATLISWGGEAGRCKKSSIEDFLSVRKRKRNKWGDSPPVLLFDQFEELFTVHPERWREREKFFVQLRHALLGDRGIRLVLVMREEYLAQLDPYIRLFPGQLRTRFRLGRLERQAGLQAIVGPMELSGRSFAPRVAEALVSNLLRIPVQYGEKARQVEGQFLEPVQLQFVCQRLWNLGVRRITFEHLQRIGNVDKALSEFYDGAIHSAAIKAPIQEGELRKWCDHDLITSLGTRGFVYKGQWKRSHIPDAAIEELVNQHLIRAEHRAGTFWYELTHDRLVGPIRASNKEYLWEEKKRTEQAKKTSEQVDRALRRSSVSHGWQLRAKASKSRDVLKAVVSEIRKQIPFDACTASIYSRSMKDARIIFSEPDNLLVPTKRWFRLPKFLAHWAAQTEITIVEDFPSFVSNWPVDADRREAELFLKMGYVSLIRYPVVRGDSVVASLTLISKIARYGDKDKTLFASLSGIENALLTAVYYEETDELKFRFALIKKVFAAKSNKEIADVITKQLSQHYKWETVCMYRTDLQNGNFVLQSQNSYTTDRRNGRALRVPANDMQALHVGVLGKAYSENRDVRSDNVHIDPELRHVYRRSRDGAISELCMRIFVGKEVVWLLNIEDSRENAFSEDEQRALRDLLNQVGGLLERIKSLNLISASFESTLTAVFVLDSQGVITKVNPSALHLLECTTNTVVGKNISTFLAENGLRRSIFTKNKTAPAFAQLRSREGRVVDVLLWASRLRLRDDADVIVLSMQEVSSARRKIRNTHSISDQNPYAEMPARTSRQHDSRQPA